jgi:phosphoglycerate dehydrogenase-like enzyme
MKVVLQYRASLGFRAQIAAVFQGDDQVLIVDEDDDEEFEAAIGEAVVLLHVLKPATPAVIAGATNLRLIQKIGVGVNTIDLAAARAHGVAVANMPGTNSPAVAEMALSLMLGVLRRTVYFDAVTRSGWGWRPDLAVLDQVGELGGRCVGLVGFGASARHLVPILGAMGARVIYAARSDRRNHAYGFRPLAELLAEADVISLHVPLTDETRGLIDETALAAMKPGAILINTARGGLVDEAALLSALETGRLRGAGLDVLAMEPSGPENPLFARPEVLVSPHVAWLTPETVNRSLAVAKENCRRLRAGEPLLHRVA